MHTSSMHSWPLDGRHHSIAARLWTVVCAAGMTALWMLLLTPNGHDVREHALDRPAAVSVRLLQEAPPKALAPSRPGMARRPATRSLSSPEIPLPEETVSTPSGHMPTVPAGGQAQAAPIDLSAQAIGRAVQAVQPGWSLSEAARSRHGLAAPHARERWTESMARSAKPDCLKGHERATLLDLPGKLLQALNDQCK